MTEAFVHEFRAAFLAIFRPNKKTYTIIQWTNEGRYWRRALLNLDVMPNISIRTQQIPVAHCDINTLRHNTSRALHVRCITTGEYLRYGDSDVSIIKKLPSSPSSFSQSIHLSEFTCTARSDEPPGTPPLWTLRVPVTVFTAHVHTSIQPLPKRIAWIIAEDASKKGETCSITLEAISPITASVTTCFHVFETNAINTWLTTKNSCPMCKQKTVATVAFQEPQPDAEVEAPQVEAPQAEAPLADAEVQFDTLEAEVEQIIEGYLDAARRVSSEIAYPVILDYGQSA
jgi:hypothetical protein